MIRRAELNVNCTTTVLCSTRSIQLGCTLLILTVFCTVVRPLEIRSISVPSYIVRGHGGHLRCDYDSAGHELYAVKWYKDKREFFRYQPGAIQPVSSFSIDGMIVNVSRSSGRDLYISHVDLSAAGDYMCEVTSGPPTFWTLYKVKHISVVDLPESVPHIRGLKTQYSIGSLLQANCTSYRSYPRVQLLWYINQTPVHQLSASRVQSWTKPEPFSMSTTQSRLTHTVSAQDFNIHNLINVRCMATMPGTDYRESQEVQARHLATLRFAEPSIPPASTAAGTSDEIPAVLLYATCLLLLITT